MESARKLSSEVMSRERTDRVKELALRFFGRVPKRVAFPGGTSRSAFVVDMGHGVFVFANREDPDTAQLEGIVLKNLAATGRVPKLVGVHAGWVVQECLEGDRLPVSLDRLNDDVEREPLLVAAIESLLVIHDCAASEKLAHRVPKLGVAENWLNRRVATADEISRAVRIPFPDIDHERIVSKLDVRRDEFVKWDARPGNALVQGAGVAWFDWEDCGRSKALDDLVFLMLDEWNPISAQLEEKLLSRFLGDFCRSQSRDEGEEYFRLFGVTHCIIRLKSALKLHSREGKWWDREYCLMNDKVGVTAEETSRLMDRIRRYSDGVAELKSLAYWAQEIEKKYEKSM